MIEMAHATGAWWYVEQRGVYSREICPTKGGGLGIFTMQAYKVYARTPPGQLPSCDNTLLLHQEAQAVGKELEVHIHTNVSYIYMIFIYI